MTSLGDPSWHAEIPRHNSCVESPSPLRTSALKPLSVTVNGVRSRIDRTDYIVTLPFVAHGSFYIRGLRSQLTCRQRSPGPLESSTVPRKTAGVRLAQQRTARSKRRAATQLHYFWALIFSLLVRHTTPYRRLLLRSACLARSGRL